MTLDQQLQTLIDQAPADGQTPQALIKIAPILRQMAERLDQLNYLIRQSSQGDWEITTLEHRHLPLQTKKVIFAYGTAKQAQMHATPGLVIQEMPVINLLFQLLALEPVDSLIVVPAKPGLAQIEITRPELQHQVRNALSLPTNLA